MSRSQSTPRELSAQRRQAKKQRRYLRRHVARLLLEVGQLKLYPQPWRWEEGALKDRYGTCLATLKDGFSPGQPYQPPVFKPEYGSRLSVETSGFTGGGRLGQIRWSALTETGASFWGGPTRWGSTWS